MMNYVYFELTVDEEVLAMSPTPLEQVVNLRDQAHGAIKQENLFEPNNIKGGFISWADVQRTRLNAVKALNELPTTATTGQRKTALQQAALISLMSLIPPEYATHAPPLWSLYSLPLTSLSLCTQSCRCGPQAPALDHPRAPRGWWLAHRSHQARFSQDEQTLWP
jgi:hypothetical protein